MTDFLMPSLGADMEAGTLREWLVKPGDTVKRGDIIAVVETQKGLIDIEIFETGKINALLIKAGDKVPVGTVMAHLDSMEAKSAPEQKRIEPVIEQPHRVRTSPLAKRLAAEFNISLSEIKGTGEGGAITKKDVENAAVLKKHSEIKIIPSDTVRMAVASAMSKSNREIPHYYLETRADISKLLEWLTEKNNQVPVKDRVLPVVAFIKATAMALKDYPDLNASWENGLIHKKEINPGFVISLRQGGIMVPAIHEADKKNLNELMDNLSDIILRARQMKLRSSELSESTIAITSLGDISVEKVYGIIYPPQVALVGFGSITEEPWAENGMLNARPVVYITLAADHRATDGHIGSKFLMAIKKNLLEPEKL